MRLIPSPTFADLYERIDMPDPTLASLLGVSAFSIRNWRRGTHEVPEGVMFEMTELSRLIDGWFAWMQKRQN